jgi:hypothetical protein
LPGGNGTVSGGKPRLLYLLLSLLETDHSSKEVSRVVKAVKVVIFPLPECLFLPYVRSANGTKGYAIDRGRMDHDPHDPHDPPASKNSPPLD